MGLRTRTSFAVLDVAATIPIAAWADREVRRSIIALGLAVWSGLTLTTAFARCYPQIFAIRVGVGSGEATGAALDAQVPGAEKGRVLVQPARTPLPTPFLCALRFVSFYVSHPFATRPLRLASPRLDFMQCSSGPCPR